MTLADAVLVAAAAGIAFALCFVHARHSDIAARRAKESPGR